MAKEKLPYDAVRRPEYTQTTFIIEDSTIELGFRFSKNDNNSRRVDPRIRIKQIAEDTVDRNPFSTN